MVVLKRLDDARRDGDRIYAVIRSGHVERRQGQRDLCPAPPGQVEGTAPGVRPGRRDTGFDRDDRGARHRHAGGRRDRGGGLDRGLPRTRREARRGAPWDRSSRRSATPRRRPASRGLSRRRWRFHHKVLPPTIKVSSQSSRWTPATRRSTSTRRPRPWLPSRGHPRRAAVSAFGFGGSNFHCVLEEAAPHKQTIDWDGDIQILRLLGRRPERGSPPNCRGGPRTRLAGCAAGSGSRPGRVRHQHRYRLLMVAQRGSTEPCRLIEEAEAG